MKLSLITPFLFLLLLFPVSGKGKELKFTLEELQLPGKRGACLTLRDPKSAKSSNVGGTWDLNLPKLEKIKPYWNYSWGADSVPLQGKYIESEFVPMIWGGRTSDRVRTALHKAVKPMIEKGKVKRLLGFNEPDGKKQANMSVELALDLWPLLESMEVPLCSPSAVHADNEWMKKFMKGAKERNYRVDYIGVHWYGGTTPKGFKDKLKSVYELYGKRPLLITEFAPADWGTKGDHKKNRHTPERVLRFAKDVLPWMERQDWILGYAWFSFGIHQAQGYTSSHYDAEGNLTALGRYYSTITKENPDGDQSIKPDDGKAHLSLALKAAEEFKKKQDGKRRK